MASDIRKPSRLITALGFSSFYGTLGGVAVLAVGLAAITIAPSLAFLLPVVHVAAGVASLAGLVVGWRRAERQSAAIDAADRAMEAPTRAPAMSAEMEPQRGSGKSFVSALEAERSQTAQAQR